MSISSENLEKHDLARASQGLFVEHSALSCQVLSILPQKKVFREGEGGLYCWGLQPSDLGITRKADGEADPLPSSRPCSQKEPVSLWLPVSAVASLGSPAAVWGREGKQSQKASSCHGRLSAGSPVSLASWDQYRGPRSPVQYEKQSVYGSEESHSAPPSWHEKGGEKGRGRQLLLSALSLGHGPSGSQGMFPFHTFLIHKRIKNWKSSLGTGNL